MTNQKDDEYQEWKGMDGATAFQLIDRNSKGLVGIGIGDMMDAWLRANTKKAVEAEREACASECELIADNASSTGEVYFSDNCAKAIRERSNVELTGAARLYRAASSD